MTTPHPWRMLRNLPEITLEWHDGGDAGWYDFDTQTISLRRGLDQAERRSTLRHELQHHFNGPVLEALMEREEIACDLAAARDLIDIRKLGEALAWTQDRDEVSIELWVDPCLIDIRLARLHPAERIYLRRRLAHLVEDAESD